MPKFFRGDTVPANGTSDPKEWLGGTGEFRAEASNWNSGTAKLQYLKQDGITWDDVGALTTLSANGHGIFVMAGTQLRVQVLTQQITGLYASASPVKDRG